MSPGDGANLNTGTGSSAIRQTRMEELPPRVAEIVNATMARADKSLNENFTGITIAGSSAENLFPLARTGVSTRPIVHAAERFLQSLSSTEREVTSFAIDDDRHWRSWHNMHFYLMRHGLGMHDMSVEQRGRAFDLLRTSMSASGYDNARDIMRLNEHAAELTGRRDEYGEYYYWISIFGSPSTTEPWGWQIDGHHLIVNCFVVGDQIVMTPDFRGSEPVAAASGPFAGTRVFADEEAKGLELMRSFDSGQQTAATLSAAPPREVVATAQVDNLVLDASGVAFSTLGSTRQDLLVELISLYTDRIRPGHAEIRLQEVTRHMDETCFAWMGGWGEDDPFYYRIANPAILIEFDHLPGIIYDNQEPTRRHVHTVVRTPHGNDYGRSLLFEHYRRHDHGAGQKGGSE